MHKIQTKSMTGSIQFLPDKIEILNNQERKELTQAMGNSIMDILSQSFSTSFNDLNNLLNSSPVARRYAIGSLVVLSILVLALVIICALCIYFRRSKKYQLVSRNAPPIPPRQSNETQNL